MIGRRCGLVFVTHTGQSTSTMVGKDRMIDCRNRHSIPLNTGSLMRPPFPELLVEESVEPSTSCVLGGLTPILNQRCTHY
jgi:hypothetical protein